MLRLIAANVRGSDERMIDLQAQEASLQLAERRLLELVEAQRLSVVEHYAAHLMDYSEIITLESDKRGGKPCIRGLRITVQDVLEYLAGGMTPEEIVADFPDLTLEDIRACLAYAADRERRLWTRPA